MNIFDSLVERRGSGSYKWDCSEQEFSLPMWVADMDFRTAPVVIKALEKRVQHGVFGYTKVPDAYYTALISWFARRHNFHIDKQWVLYTSGVIPAISAVLKALTKPGDKVVLQTPVYNCFFSSIRNMDCQVIENPLLCIDGYYEMDFIDLESKVSDPSAKVLLLCNPHNPVGRAWRKDELVHLAEICFRNGVMVVSDEIHCDLVFPGVEHQSFAALGDNYLAHSVTCVSPSKSFNIAGLQIASIVAKNSEIRDKIDRVLNIHEVCDVNPFGVVALIAAYNEGDEWLDALIVYLHENYQMLYEFILAKLPDFKVIKQDATYLAWIDIRSLNISSQEVVSKLGREVGLLLNSGALYGQDGEGFIRLNMACPSSVLLDGLKRIEKVFG